MKKIMGLSVLICVFAFAQDKGRNEAPRGGGHQAAVGGGHIPARGPAPAKASEPAGASPVALDRNMNSCLREETGNASGSAIFSGTSPHTITTSSRAGTGLAIRS